MSSKYLLKSLGKESSIQASLYLKNNYWRQLFLTGFLVIALALTGCQDTEEENTNAGDGELILGLTDAEGDFLHYTVNVTQITLTKQNNAIVNVLPANTQVDFAQYTEMTEFLTAAMVPSGIYKKAILSLDYTGSDIWVEDVNGDAVQVTNIVDESNNAITTLDVKVHLEGRNRLLIAPGTPAHMTLDFDLEASNKVEFDVNGVPTMTVDPLLLADVELDRPKIHRLRGPLARVQVDKNSFDVIIRPFHHNPVNDKRFGTLHVKVNDETVYDINNMDYMGSEGLLEMDALPAFAATVVVGRLKFNPRRFEAREVYAGSSVPGGTLDVVKGTVIARAGNVLTVKGVTLIRAGGSVIFGDTVEATIADTTIVKKQMDVGMHTIEEISVGQRVSIFGTLTNDLITSLVLDATDGWVRMKVSTLRGTSTTNVGIDPLFSIDLQRINRRHIGILDFSGTGIDATNDADPMNYEINTSTLDLSSILNGSPVVVKGFVQPFGQAPEDFDATSVTDLSNVRATMALSWNPATSTPFNSSSSTEVILNVIDMGRFHHFAQAGVVIDMNDLSSAPKLLASATGEGVFVIVYNGTRQLLTQFGDFVVAVEGHLVNGLSVKTMKSSGSFDQHTAEMLVRDIVVTIE